MMTIHVQAVLLAGEVGHDPERIGVGHGLHSPRRHNMPGLVYVSTTLGMRRADCRWLGCIKDAHLLVAVKRQRPWPRVV